MVLQDYCNAALSNTKTAVSASRVRIHSFVLYNPNTAVAFVQFFNKAIADVTVGTTAPKKSIPVPPGGVAVGTYEDDFALPYNEGLVLAATTTASGSTAPTSALVVASLDYS
jgi:hypothetical protein